MHFGTETFSLGRPTMEARDSSCDLRCTKQHNFCTFLSFLGGSELLLMVGTGQQLPRAGTGSFWGELQQSFAHQCSRPPPKVKDQIIMEIGDDQGSKGEEEGTYQDEIHHRSKTDFKCAWSWSLHVWVGVFINLRLKNTTQKNWLKVKIDKISLKGQALYLWTYLDS